ncbi:MAG TPA: DHHA1 domain-containing protein, partial [Cryomorphaceae bacterium]|nr:DHHA1 domain-containing protein [Cryomorphaceae bacterium]
SPNEPVKALQGLISEQQELKSEIAELKQEKASQLKSEILSQMEEIEGIHFIARHVPLDASQVKDLAFQLRNEVTSLFAVLATSENRKATISVALSDDLVKSDRYNSGKIVKELASFIKGGGGGQAFFATAGGKDPDGIKDALAAARAIVLSKR